MADIEGLRDALVGVETAIDADEADIKTSVAALEASHLHVEEMLARLADVLGKLKAEVSQHAPDEALRDEVLALVDEVSGKLDELRAA